MKILWFSHRDISHPNSGGAERTIYEISKRLTSKGHCVIWVSVSPKKNYMHEFIDGIDVRRYPGNVIVHLLSHSIINNNDPDVIIDDLGHAVPWASERLTNKPGTVFFRHLHRRSLSGQVSLPLRVGLSGMERLYATVYKKWTFVTETESSIKDLESLNINRNRVIKIPPGVDFNIFKPLQRTSNPSLVYFGGFRDYKRPWESLYVLKDVLKENNSITLIMIGSGPSLESTKLISKNLGVESNVKFMGKVGTDTLAELVGSSWVNIHSSVTEGFGYSVLEASAAGTPTVAYDVPGVRDLIKNNVNGFLVKDENRNLMASKVREVINNFDILSKSSIVEAHNYSWEKTTNEWANHLKRIMNLKPKQ